MKKIAIITGASGNLGKACVSAFLDEDYDVIATVPPQESLGYNVPDRVIVKEVDLTNEGDVSRFIADQALQRSIDCALLLVGGFAMGNINDTSNAQLQKMFSLNFFTAYHCARPLFQKMQEQPTGGRIVIIGSKPALNPKEGKNAVAYALSKSLLFDLANILNAESSEGKVVTHVIAPSVIDTPPNREAMPTADFNAWVTPEAIASNILWLCSEKGASVRGGVFKLYGGVKE
ncbi:oxidoreductase, short chain dehydrogenase/reductase family [Fulvivirga imtechensis AK7]|uniref:Oxidoreductase, short chain dehydrogenase/reductase family n=1 Tax=Fulvivirga imtechensis AK7 TaxID=1237149 RepID=L8JKF2_9BACT|nr:SDR family NAD(P)-dependent oxidoreductase [Fulvivirga imtechensis]ELR67989.1 oxidoreductase, short chain dehydrogenase/reductase family [Fulvivirga imtechensis AK7]